MGTLTETDVKDWSDYIRRRDLSPSITNQLIYPRQRPNDKGDYVITIGDKADVLIEVFDK